MALPRPPAYCCSVPPRLLALVLAAAPLAAAAQDEDTFSEAPPREHLRATAWGGRLLNVQGDRPGADLYGGELAWVFPFIELGVMAQAYTLDASRSRRDPTPVLLLRVEQSFETRRGLEAVLAIGLGAAHTGRANDWQAWYQFAIGLRLGLGPLFLAGEVGFEQLDLFRLGAGIGFRL